MDSGGTLLKMADDFDEEARLIEEGEGPTMIQIAPPQR